MSDAAHATAWRVAFARQVATGYARNPKVAAVVLAGSVARGWADQHSDIELDVFWNAPPTKQDRIATVETAGGVVDVDWSNPPDAASYRRLLMQQQGRLSQIWPYEDLEWSEHFYVNGVNIGVSAFLVTTLEGWLDDVTLRADTDDDKQMRLAAMQHAIPLHGADLVAGWQARIQFNEALQRALIDDLLDPLERWWDRGFLVDRDAFIPRSDLLVQMERLLLRLLLAVNRTFLPDPRFKWADRLIDQMTVKPVDLATRLRQVLRADGATAIALMSELMAETLSLIEDALPGCDTSFGRAWLSYQRAIPSWPVPRTGD